MKRVAVDFTWYYNKAVHAGPKARKDASRTLAAMGFDVETLFFKAYRSARRTSICRNLSLVRLLLRSILTADEVLFQYPTVLPSWLLRVIRLRGTKIIYLIHDLERLREGYTDLSRREMMMLSKADMIIAHNSAMRSYLRGQGLTCRIADLMLFDYYTDRDDEEPDLLPHDSVTFCGNLEKSRFLQYFDDARWSLPTNLYGVGLTHEFSNPDIKFRGVFSADDPVGISGGWGLVWDGDDASTCDTTPTGRYLRYNTSHKLSLYFVTGRPVIVWSQSALAGWVVEHGLGIAVDSLWEVPGRIASVTPAEYDRMLDRISVVRARLLTGGFLKEILIKQRT